MENQTLGQKVAAQRIAKAERAERLAAAHGAETAHGREYAAEAKAWREDAARAERGDTGPPGAFLKHAGPAGFGKATTLD